MHYADDVLVLRNICKDEYTKGKHEKVVSNNGKNATTHFFDLGWQNKSFLLSS